MLVHIKDIVRKAEKGGYAVGAFNVHNLETVIGVAQAAARMKSPAIMQVSEGAVKYMGLKIFVNIAAAAAETTAGRAPLALNLDHGSSSEMIKACLDAGFSSVHMDASALPLKENIKITRQAAVRAHRKGAWAQGEIGSIMGGHGQVGGRITGVPLADPEEVIAFIEAAGVDTIAAAIGTAHGAFTNEDIHFDILKKILARTDKPFVLHGGSGVDDKKIKKAIKLGVRVVNIGTDIKVAFSKTLIANCLKNKKETDPRHLLRPTMQAVEEVTAAKMKLFGSAGKL